MFMILPKLKLNFLLILMFLMGVMVVIIRILIGEVRYGDIVNDIFSLKFFNF